MADQQHINWLREGVYSWNTRRQQADSSRLYFPNFVGATLFSQLQGSDYEVRRVPPSGEGFVLDGINLSRGRFQDAMLPYFGFKGANFEKAEFEKALLVASDFSNANLNGANFTDANLSYANLQGASLTGADLTRAKLVKANLKDVNLRDAILDSTDFTSAYPWTSVLFPDPEDPVMAPPGFLKEVREIGDLATVRQYFEAHYKNNLNGTSFNDGYIFYFRGEGSDSWELRPYIMREEKTVLRDKEGEMLLDLMSQRPEDFIGATSALSQWVIAQHHGLKTRLLDITRNPLVALFHACEHPLDSSGNTLPVNGILHVFVVPKDIVKTFDSDAVSVVTNLAKLPRSQQDRLMGQWVDPKEIAPDEIFFDRANKYFHIMDRLYHHIRQEKPHFKERIDIKDFFRVFAVEPQQSFERIRVQSGAFLLSAFHERFEAEEILKLNKNTPVYHHYKLTVPTDRKNEIVDELRFLNITHEVLFPSLDAAAKAILKRYEEHNSPKTE